MFKLTSSLSKKSALITAAALTCASITLVAQAAGTDNRQYGSYVTTAPSDKTIYIDANTKYANVDEGETVTFVDGSQRFNWTFSRSKGVTSMPLSAIAPAGFAANKVKVYVDSNPLYRN